MFLFDTMFHKILLPSTAINNLFVTPSAPCVTTFVNLHGIGKQKIIVAIFLGQNHGQFHLFLIPASKSLGGSPLLSNILTSKTLVGFDAFFCYFLLFNAVSKNKNN